MGPPGAHFVSKLGSTKGSMLKDFNNNPPSIPQTEPPRFTCLPHYPTNLSPTVSHRWSHHDSPVTHSIPQMEPPRLTCHPQYPTDGATLNHLSPHYPTDGASVTHLSSTVSHRWSHRDSPATHSQSDATLRMSRAD